jgi:hypothetical protein
MVFRDTPSFLDASFKVQPTGSSETSIRSTALVEYAPVLDEPGSERVSSSRVSNPSSDEGSKFKWLALSTTRNASITDYEGIMVQHATTCKGVIYLAGVTMDILKSPPVLDSGFL